MALPTLQAQQFHVDLLTEHYFFSGLLEPFGQLVNYLGHPDRTTYIVKHLEALSLDAGAVMGAFKADELIVKRDIAAALRVHEDLPPGSVQFLQKQRKVRLFITGYIVQGIAYSGPDTTFPDLFDAIPSFWIPMTDVLVHPQKQGVRLPFSQSKLIFINKRHVNFFEAVA